MTMLEKMARAAHAELKAHERYVGPYQDGVRYDDEYEKEIGKATTLDGDFDLEGVVSAALSAAREPTETMWRGLARDIVMWMDMYDGGKKTPRNLFRHLEQVGREIPQWLRDEPEMKALDHVPSKATRAVIIFRAMIDAILNEGT